MNDERLRETAAQLRESRLQALTAERDRLQRRVYDLTAQIRDVEREAETEA